MAKGSARIAKYVHDHYLAKNGTARVRILDDEAAEVVPATQLMSGPDPHGPTHLTDADADVIASHVPTLTCNMGHDAVVQALKTVPQACLFERMPDRGDLAEPLQTFVRRAELAAYATSCILYVFGVLWACDILLS